MTLSVYDMEGRLLGSVSREVPGGGRFTLFPLFLSASGIRFFHLRSSITAAIGIDSVSHDGVVEPSSIALRLLAGDDVRMLRGGGAALDVTIDRTNHTGSVVVKASGLPSGVTAPDVPTTGN